eukprot:7055779-Pyramimonas_sp.AAC.1
MRCASCHKLTRLASSLFSLSRPFPAALPFRDYFLRGGRATATACADCDTEVLGLAHNPHPELPNDEFQILGQN